MIKRKLVDTKVSFFYIVHLSNHICGHRGGSYCGKRISVPFPFFHFHFIPLSSLPSYRVVYSHVYILRFFSFCQYFFPVCTHMDVWRGFSIFNILITSHRADTQHSRPEPLNFRLRNLLQFVFISGWYLSQVFCLYYEGVWGDNSGYTLQKFWSSSIPVKQQKGTLYLIAEEVLVFLFTKVIKSLCHSNVLYSCHCEQLLGNS